MDRSLGGLIVVSYFKLLTAGLAPVYEKLLFCEYGSVRTEKTMIKIDFEKMGGLIPAVIQDVETGEVLMVAFMDEKTLNLTLESGKTWFFSRTRNKYWMKGEESGNTQDVVEVLTDCDADTVVIKVKQNGPAACHTGNRSCFYVKYEDGAWVEHSNPLFDPAEVYKK
jgi:phosphoribosyl-AMP cyclohydrolase